MVPPLCHYRTLSSRVLTSKNGKSGAHSGGETPVPIPNTEVKPASADGSGLATDCESRSVPGLPFFVSGVRRMEGSRCRFAPIFLCLIALNLLFPPFTPPLLLSAN
jgi:hypothetical protein